MMKKVSTIDGEILLLENEDSASQTNLVRPKYGDEFVDEFIFKLKKKKRNEAHLPIRAEQHDGRGFCKDNTTMRLCTRKVY